MRHRSPAFGREIFYCRYALAISRARASRGVQRLHHRKTTTCTVSKRSTASTHSPLRLAKTVRSGATHLHRRRTTTHKTSKEAQRLASRASTPPTPCPAGRHTYTAEEQPRTKPPKKHSGLASRASTPPTPCSAGRRTYTVEETTTRAVPKRSIASTHSWHRPTQAPPNGAMHPAYRKTTPLKAGPHNEAQSDPPDQPRSRSSRSSMVWRRSMTCAPDSDTATTAGISAWL